MGEDDDTGFNVEQVNALKFAMELNEKQSNEANEFLNNYRKRLEEENAFLRDENERLFSELDDIKFALRILRGD